jgi:hypothetical protein
MDETSARDSLFQTRVGSGAGISVPVAARRPAGGVWATAIAAAIPNPIINSNWLRAFISRQDGQIGGSAQRSFCERRLPVSIAVVTPV